MRLKISHTTRYQFDAPVRTGLQQVRKTPKATPSQKILRWDTSIGNGHKELSFEDHHLNHVDLMSFARDTSDCVVVSEGEVELTETHGVVGPHRGLTPLWLFRAPTARTKAGAGAKALAKAAKGKTVLDQMHDLSHRILAAVPYELGASEPDWTAEDAVEAAKGVCQDHAHVFIAAARELGIPARYVSGYLMLNDRVAQDAMHAWAEAHIDGLGWVGFDVSNGICPDIRYVRVATGLDYADAAPVIGSRQGGSGESLTVEIEVQQQ